MYKMQAVYLLFASQASDKTALLSQDTNNLDLF